MKKGPLSNSDKEYIAENLKMSAEELSAELERSLKAVAAYRDSLTANKKTEVIKKPTDMDLYARNKEYGVVIMTENASSAADDKRKKEPKTMSHIRKLRSAIHRIKE